ncbi:MAG: hypothetical protein EXQ85_01615 [Alphaproteobacteria bacterium]|nr:hypothetical protein [Alphaproteobacteria bacterium]
MIGRWLMIAIHAPLYVGLRLLVRRALGRGPLPRGMSPWRDLLDWLGGYPFEVAKPEAVVAFCRARALSPVRVVTVGGRHGCNEFVFMRAGKGGT